MAKAIACKGKETLQERFAQEWYSITQYAEIVYSTELQRAKAMLNQETNHPFVVHWNIP